MSIDVLVLGGVVLLAALQFFTRKQAGLLIFILIASSLFAGAVEQPVVIWMTGHGFLSGVKQLGPLVNILLTALPVAVALFAIPKDHLRVRQLIGAVLFAVVLVTVLSSDLSSFVSQTVPSQSHLLLSLVTWQGWILALGMAYAVLSLYFGGSHKGKRSRKE